MHAVQEWVTGENFLRLMRHVTRRDDIRAYDSCASRYGPGHFLTRHDARHRTHQRIAVWVLSMTPEWNENWGAPCVLRGSGQCRRGPQACLQYPEFVHGAPATFSIAGHTIRRRTANQLSGMATGLTHQINVAICSKGFFTVAERGTIAVFAGRPKTNIN